ncbi:hypothetical protein BN1058_02671 [Paraliobacillus sp. PM-2]|uniref:hypothetical protein n=1 Tax=Paraliobacillus sp. PM-2 TaxID=1462524 RepID=UPI00061BCA32|nr:hypothetical protein [Paraliobacillus sp. PM-2]CQR48305.1 hypothetical protein BN1058_02671 [Paraliobacillus sp. PM-2]
MKWLSVLGIILIALLITLYEWPKLKKNQKKEKKAFVVLMLTSVTLSISILYFPDMPGPTELIDKIFKPFGKLLSTK